MINWLVYLVVGKIFIFLWQQFPLPEFLEKNKSIKKLHECELCSGVWIYSILAWAMGMDVLSLFGFPFVFLVTWGITGGTTSFIMHIFSIGWKARFEVINL